MIIGVQQDFYKLYHKNRYNRIIGVVTMKKQKTPDKILITFVQEPILSPESEG